jgi:hypothetical protein
MITLDFSAMSIKLKQDGGKTFVFDPIRKRWMVLTPEEHVRQYILVYLLEGMLYPISLIAVERKIMVGKLAKRFDIVIFDRDHQPWLLIECKEPEVVISEGVLQQLLAYHSALPCKYWMLTNGHQTYCADATDKANINWMDALPAYGA